MSESVSDIQYRTPDDLANMLQISVGTVANWRTKGVGPEFIRIGGLVRYHPKSVQDWLDAEARRK